MKLEAQGGCLGGRGDVYLQFLSWSFLPILQQFPAGEPGFFQDCFNVKSTLNQEHSKPQPSLFKWRKFPRQPSPVGIWCRSRETAGNATEEAGGWKVKITGFYIYWKICPSLMCLFLTASSCITCFRWWVFFSLVYKNKNYLWNIVLCCI